MARPVLGAAVILATLWGGLAPLSAEDGATEQVLGKIHQLRLHERSTPDGLHFAYVTADMDTREFSVVHDGQVDQTFKSISGDLFFSPDGSRFGYSAHQADEGASFYVIDGQPIGPFQRTVSKSLRFGPQSDRLVYFVKKEGKWRLVVDGKEEAPLWDSFDTSSLDFSPDGRHIAYLAQKEGKWRLALDGEEQPDAWDRVKGLSFSPDGGRLAYEGVIGEWDGGDHYIVADGEKGPRFNGIWPLVFSPDGKRLAYKAWFKAADEAATEAEQKKFAVVVDGERGPAYDGIQGPTFSADGKHVAYLALKDGKWRLALDGKEDAGGWDHVKGPRFSPDGSRLAYHGVIGEWEGGDHYIVADGEKGPRFNGIWPFVFGPDGKRMAYKAWFKAADEAATEAEQKKFAVVVDGKRSPAYDGVRGPILSPDGTHVAYLALTDGKWRLVLDGEEDAGGWDQVKGPTFSPDGGRLAYEGVIGEWEGGKHHMVVDGKVGPAHDGATVPIFSPDGRRIAYFSWTMTDRKLRLVLDGEEAANGYTSVGALGRRKGKDALGHDRIFVSGLIGQENPTIEPGGIMFSPSGEHLAYFGRTPDKKWRLNLDGTEGPSYELVGKVAFFEADGYVKYLAATGDTLFLVTQPFPAGE